MANSIDPKVLVPEQEEAGVVSSESVSVRPSILPEDDWCLSHAPVGVSHLEQASSVQSPAQVEAPGLGAGIIAPSVTYAPVFSAAPAPVLTQTTYQVAPQPSASSQVNAVEPSLTEPVVLRGMPGIEPIFRASEGVPNGQTLDPCEDALSTSETSVSSQSVAPEVPSAPPSVPTSPVVVSERFSVDQTAASEVRLQEPLVQRPMTSEDAVQTVPQATPEVVPPQPSQAVSQEISPAEVQRSVAAASVPVAPQIIQPTPSATAVPPLAKRPPSVPLMGVDLGGKTASGSPIKGISSATGRSMHRESIGYVLASKRESLGLTPYDIADRIKFSHQKITDLENERWDQLHKGFLLRGLVRQYAEALGLDPEQALQILAHTLQEDVVEPPKKSLLGVGKSSPKMASSAPVESEPAPHSGVRFSFKRSAQKNQKVASLKAQAAGLPIDEPEEVVKPKRRHFLGSVSDRVEHLFKRLRKS